MSELAVKRKQSALKRLESAISETELAILERLEEIKRCEVQLATQKAQADEVAQEIKKLQGEN